MISASLPKRVLVAGSIIALVFSGGCRVLDVDMTSTPDAVRRGDPVTFDIKITNRSQCPLKPTVGAALLAFIPLSAFNLLVDLPPNPPPELLEIVEALQMFFDELCTGGDPPPPMFPAATALATSCTRSSGELICEVSGPAPGREGEQGGVTFATSGDRLRCAIDGTLISCRLRIPLPAGATGAGGTIATAVQDMSCFTGDDFGIPELSESESLGLCFVGNPMMGFEVLPGGEMATGTVILPARGAGVVRNLVFGISDQVEDLGVCKSGTSDAGEPCALDDSTDCDSGSGECGAGICVGGSNAGNGCDTDTDCPDMGMDMGSCQLCADFPGNNSTLSLDCTTTHVGVEPAPATSLLSTAVLAGLLLAMGVQWSRRRSARREP